MKKGIIGLEIFFVLITIGLNGCNEQQSQSNLNKKPKVNTVYNIGSSITISNIKYTFLSAQWTEKWGYPVYSLEVKAENIDNERAEGVIALTKYEMENGYKYEYLNDNLGLGTELSVNPGKSKTITIVSDIDEIDRDFLPVSKIHNQFRREESFLQDSVLRSIILNILIIPPRKTCIKTVFIHVTHYLT